MEITSSQWEESLDLLKRLIKAFPVYASKGLEKAQYYLSEYMKKNGWDEIVTDLFYARDISHLEGYVDVQDFGNLYKNYSAVPKRNVIGVIDSKKPGPTLLFNGHVDVDFIQNRQAWEGKNGWKSGRAVDHFLRGRGATDMLSGLVSEITVANILKNHKELWKGKLIVTAVTDEEIGGNGTVRALDWLQKKGYLNDKPTECLIAEPSDGNVCLNSLGFLHLILEFQALPTHMGVARKEDKALWKAISLMQNFDEILLKVAQRIDPEVDEKKLIFNFGIIEGGKDSAIPIPYLRIEGTVFFPETIPLVELKNGLIQTLGTFYDSLTIKCSRFGFEGADFPPSHLFSECLTLSKSSSSTTFPSPCDARLFKKYGVPTVIFGPGYLKDAHADNESICLIEVKKYVQTLLRSALAYFNR